MSIFSLADGENFSSKNISIMKEIFFVSINYQIKVVMLNKRMLVKLEAHNADLAAARNHSKKIATWSRVISKVKKINLVAIIKSSNSVPRSPKEHHQR